MVCVSPKKILWGPLRTPKISHLGAIKGAVTRTQLPGLPKGAEAPLQLLRGQIWGWGGQCRGWDVGGVAQGTRWMHGTEGM